MFTHRRISLSAALVIFGGSAYLATPATATPPMAEPVQECSLQSWQTAAKRANEFCGGPSSFAGYCDRSGNFVITEVHCQSQY